MTALLTYRRDIQVELGPFAVHTTTTAAADLVSFTCSTLVSSNANSAQWKGAKLGQALSVHKHVDHLAVILAENQAQGLEFGPDFTNMDYLPLVDEGVAVDENSIYSTYDREPIEFPGTWDTDARLCLQATAPRPCTVLAAVVHGEAHV